jgi:hypothetical protein
MQGYGSKCGQPIHSGVTSSSEKQKIVDAHNNLRRKVAKGQETQGKPGPQPSAANMKKIVSLILDVYRYSSRDSSVGIATGYGLGDGEVGVRLLLQSRIFSSSRCSAPSLLSNGYRGLTPRT